MKFSTISKKPAIQVHQYNHFSFVVIYLSLSTDDCLEKHISEIAYYVASSAQVAK